MLTQIKTYGETRTAKVIRASSMGRSGYFVDAIDEHGETHAIAGCRPVAVGEDVTLIYTAATIGGWWRLAE